MHFDAVETNLIGNTFRVFARQKENEIDALLERETLCCQNNYLYHYLLLQLAMEDGVVKLACH